MRVIYNKYFPFRPFLATNVLGIVFCRGKRGRLKPDDINHEYIHTLQQREMLFVGFALWYYLEWLVNYLRCRDKMKAYYMIYFEREAYQNEKNLNYARERKPFAWLRMMWRDSRLARDVMEFARLLRDFVREDFRWSKYLYCLAVAVMLVIGQVRYNLYDILLAPSFANGTSMLAVPLFYVAIYYAVLVPTVCMHGERWRLRQWQLWVMPAALVALDGAGQGFDAYKQWAEDYAVYFKDRYYLQLVGAYLFRSVAVLLGICCFRWITTGRFGLYGMTRSRRFINIYAIAYIMLIPLFVAVSQTAQFQAFYPKLDMTFYSGALGWDDWQTGALFEACYANDFLRVESMYRGALVIGVARWLGPRAILPMALTYMSVHLGKPDLEMCSSVIGGYLLGILALRTRHLWGGIIIHLGIAMLFEVLGFWW